MIRKLVIEGVIGIRRAAIELGGLTLIHGPNGAGKSSALEAVRCWFTGSLPRGVLKKDLPLVTHDGCDVARVTVETEDGQTTKRDIGEKRQPVIDSLAARLAIGSTSIGALSPAEVAALAAEVSGAGADAAWAAGRLAEEGVEARVIEKLKTMLSGGDWAAAHQFADREATMARGVWRGITQEVYGSKKAEGWAPKLPNRPPGDVDAMAKTIAGTEQSVARARELLGMFEAAGTPPDGREIPKLEAEIAEERAKLDGQDDTLACPHCAGRVVLEGLAPGQDMRLVKPVSSKKLADLEHQRDQLLSRIERYQDIMGNPALVGVDAEQLRHQIAVGEEAIARNRSQSQAISIWERENADAEGKAARAAAAHADAVAWDAAAKLLAPDGLPAESMGRLLGPIREALQRNSEAWPERVDIGADMVPRYGVRPWALCSESERWRVDATCAIAFAELGGVPLVLLDQLDVLEPAARMPAIRWLKGVGVQVVAAATLKKPAAIEGVECVWIEDGCVDSAARAAA